MDKEELYKTILISPIYKYPLLNEIYAIRDENLETEDYTIAVNGFISVDSLLDNYNLINEKQELISWLEDKIKEYKLCFPEVVKALQEVLDFVKGNEKNE